MSISSPCQFTSESNLVRCMLFQADQKLNFKGGLGSHQFGRIPCNGEYIALGIQTSDQSEVLYQVVDVIHTGFSGYNHAAEIYVMIPDDVTIVSSHLSKYSKEKL
jgi:hypothetical protein